MAAEPDLSPYGLSVVTSSTSSYSVVLPDSNVGATKVVVLAAGDPYQVTVNTSQGSFYVSPSLPVKPLIFTGNPSWTSTSEYIPSFFPTRQLSTNLFAGTTSAYNQGFSVAISADGNTLVVGADKISPNGGFYVFARTNGVWTLKATYTAPSSTLYFRVGFGVAISANGSVIFTCSLYGNNTTNGGFIVFSYSNGVLTQTAVVSPTNGSGSIACSSDGNTVVIGNFGYPTFDGSFTVYSYSGGSWISGGSIVGTVSSGNLGYSVAISSDGSTIAVGQPGNNTTFIYTYVFSSGTGTLTLQATITTPGGTYAGVVALSKSGDTLAIGAPTVSTLALNVPTGVGSTYVYTRTGTTWTLQSQTPLVGSGYTGNSGQGGSLSLSSDGNTLAIGGAFDNGQGTQDGATWVFTRDPTGTWTQQGNLLFGTGGNSTTYLNEGFAVALSGDGSILAIGGPAAVNTSIGNTWIFT